MFFIRYSNHRKPEHWLLHEVNSPLPRSLENKNLHGLWRETRPPETTQKKNRPQRNSKVKYMDEEMASSLERGHFETLRFLSRLSKKWPEDKPFLIIEQG